MLLFKKKPHNCSELFLFKESSSLYIVLFYRSLHFPSWHLTLARKAETH